VRIVIQCAARKSARAGKFQTVDGRNVMFVADPGKAPQQTGIHYARPDDLSEDSNTWRDRLVAYNQTPGVNPLSMLPAYQLYDNRAYQGLVSKFGVDKIFILSAGWGLVTAHYLLPDYDITFSAMAEPYKRRRTQAVYRDFCSLKDESDDIVFLGGKDYLPLFCSLTNRYAAQKVVYYNSATTPSLPPGYRAAKYVTTTRTNWHYECADDLISGHLTPRYIEG
jgi:hypothetical protein